MKGNIGDSRFCLWLKSARRRTFSPLPHLTIHRAFHDCVRDGSQSRRAHYAHPSTFPSSSFTTSTRWLKLKQSLICRDQGRQQSRPKHFSSSFPQLPISPIELSRGKSYISSQPALENLPPHFTTRLLIFTNHAPSLFATWSPKL